MLTPFEIVFCCSLAAYLLVFIFLRVGLSRANSFSRNIIAEPSVTVIVAARNEELSIEPCLTSLLQLDYPASKLEIVAINDHSTDSTLAIMQRMAAEHPSLKVLTAKPGSGNLQGKTNAITQAIECSSGEILMFTDADCRVSPSWIRETIQAFSDDTGIVGGFTILQASSTFEAIQALDWMILFSTASSTAGWNIPLTAIGNNLSVRRSAYEATGGYARIPFSVTEDYALVRAILEKTTFRLRFPLLKNAYISSTACDSWKQLIRQKKRWGTGGLDMITHGFIIFSICWLLSLMFIVGSFASSFFVWGSVLASKLVIDFIYLSDLLRRINKKRYLLYFLPFELYFSLYILVIPFLALFSKNVHWKDRTF